MNTPATHSDHARVLLALGLPLVGSQVAQFGLHVTQTLLLGWYGGVPLAVGVLGASSFFVVFVVGSGFSKAVLPLVAAAQTRGDDREVRRTTRMGLWLVTLFGLIVYPLFWWSEPLLLALRQKPEVAAMAQDFLRIAGLGMVPALQLAVLRSYLSALGRTQVVLWVTLAALPVNFVLNWMLIFGHFGAAERGVQGAALATLAVQVLSLGLIAAYCAGLPALRRYHLFQNFWRADRNGLGAVFRLGWPMGLTGLAESSLFQASALMMGAIGATALAAHGIALEITALAFMVHIGLSNAVTVTTGRAFAGGDGVALRRAAVVGLAMSMGFAALVVLVFVLARGPLSAIFINPADPHRAEILAMAEMLLLCAAAFHIADALQAMALGLLAGIQDTRVPMVLATLSYWMIGIPTSYVLGLVLGLGGVGVWLGLVTGLVAASVLLIARFWRRLSPAG